MFKVSYKQPFIIILVIISATIVNILLLLLLLLLVNLLLLLLLLLHTLLLHPLLLLLLLLHLLLLVTDKMTNKVYNKGYMKLNLLQTVWKRRGSTVVQRSFNASSIALLFLVIDMSDANHISGNKHTC